MFNLSILTWMLLVFTLQSTLCDDGYFWHVTDFHYDNTYDGARLSCDKVNTPATIGPYGTYWCDSPWLLINSSVQAMAKIYPQVDFLLWTGDTVLHASDDHLNYTINAGILDATTNALEEGFPGTSVYASFGNHDYYPNNQFPPFNNLLYNDTLARWRDWINDASQDENFLKGGYYTVKTQHGLRIICLNTNLYYTSNKAAANVSDPADQFVWLNQTLVAATAAGEKVLITAHIPPGIHTPSQALWMYENFNSKLVEILQQHAGIIVGMHFGHDHADGFKVLPDVNGNPSAPVFIAPSVTPWKYIPTAPEHNPGIRLVKYDRHTGKHLEIRQYYLDIVAANQSGNATWRLEYNTSEVYGVTELSATSLSGLIDKMKNSNGDEFKSYWRHFTVSPRNLQPCDEICHATIICGYTNFKMPDLNNCKSALISSATSLSPFVYLVVVHLIVVMLQMPLAI